MFLYKIGSNCNASKQPKDLPDYVFGCECMAHRGNWDTETKKTLPKNQFPKNQKTNTKRTKKTKTTNFPGLLICMLISTAFTESRKIGVFCSFGSFCIVFLVLWELVFLVLRELVFLVLWKLVFRFILENWCFWVVWVFFCIGCFWRQLLFSFYVYGNSLKCFVFVVVAFLASVESPPPHPKKKKKNAAAEVAPGTDLGN